MMGQTPAGAAQALAQRGYGDAGQIQRALEAGDVKGLNFIQKLGPQIMQNNPNMAQQARRFLGMN